MEITGSELHQDGKRSQGNNHRFQVASENKLATVKRAVLLLEGGTAPQTPELWASTARTGGRGANKNRPVASREQRRPSDNSGVYISDTKRRFFLKSEANKNDA